MTDYDQMKLINVALYVLNETQGTDIYHLLEILYFAEQKHLAEWGHRITADELRALEFGPVHSKLYDASKNQEVYGTNLKKLFADNIEFAGSEAPNVMFAKHQANLDYLSISNREALDESIKENANLSFNELVKKSRNIAWKNARKKTNGTNVINLIDVAKEVTDDEDMLDYIKEEIDIDVALRKLGGCGGFAI